MLLPAGDRGRFLHPHNKRIDGHAEPLAQVLCSGKGGALCPVVELGTEAGHALSQRYIRALAGRREDFPWAGRYAALLASARR
ncbi:MAG: hypothetical protein ACR2MP_07190, partial [Streptosporangiaceae bacterium]